MNRNSKWFVGGLLIVGIVLGVALVSAGTAVVHWSGSTQFCGTFCHSMDDAYASYKKGLHGQTHSGFNVGCVDCHLKYESEHSIGRLRSWVFFSTRLKAALPPSGARSAVR